jgi:hypothetical protein
MMGSMVRIHHDSPLYSNETEDQALAAVANFSLRQAEINGLNIGTGAIAFALTPMRKFSSKMAGLSSDTLP